MTTTLDLEQRKKLVEWMVDRSVDTDIDSQARTHRKEILAGMGEAHVREMAGKEGIELSDEHLGVIEALRGEVSLAVCPPLIINREQVDEMVDKLKMSLEQMI